MRAARSAARRAWSIRSARTLKVTYRAQRRMVQTSTTRSATTSISCQPALDARLRPPRQQARSDRGPARHARRGAAGRRHRRHRGAGREGIAVRLLVAHRQRPPGACRPRRGRQHRRNGSLSDIPATRRFFLGGGGSIRGYEYRSIGPVSGGEVVGGLSFWEASRRGALPRHRQDRHSCRSSMRARPTRSRISTSPRISIVGAGVGLRYYTPLGPLRFDVAMPVRPDLKLGDFAFYVGLGQSF